MDLDLDLNLVVFFSMSSDKPTSYIMINVPFLKYENATSLSAFILSVYGSSMGLSSFSTTKRALKMLYGVRWCIMVIQGRLRSSRLVSIESRYVISY